MSVSHRRSLALIGGGIVIAAGASAGGFLATRAPGKARAPWSAAGSYDEPRMRALSYAILAPNPHNRQPWLAELVGDDTIRIFRDPARNLPATDPFDRQLTIGMGCFLELLAIAAAETGHSTTLDLFPDGDARPVAVARLVPGAAADPLFAQVLLRRTNRRPYEDRAVPGAAVQALSAHADIIADPDRVALLRDLTLAAWRIEATTPAPMLESVNLTRAGKAAINANPDGISLGGPLFDSLVVAGMLRPEDQLDPSSAGFRQAQDVINAGLAATPAYAVITTPGNSRADQIAAGRRWMRLHLAVTGLGLAMQPVSQALQEYPEMAAARAQVHELLAAPGETVQMLGRLGYGPAVPPAPRWPLETRMIDA